MPFSDSNFGCLTKRNNGEAALDIVGNHIVRIYTLQIIDFTSKIKNIPENQRLRLKLEEAWQAFHFEAIFSH